MDSDDDDRRFLLKRLRKGWSLSIPCEEIAVIGKGERTELLVVGVLVQYAKSDLRPVMLEHVGSLPLAPFLTIR